MTTDSHNTQHLLRSVERLSVLEAKQNDSRQDMTTPHRMDVAGAKLDLAAMLIEMAAFELTPLHSPTQTSELIVIAGRLGRIKDKLVVTQDNFVLKDDATEA